jgi:hypothetical protein
LTGPGRSLRERRIGRRTEEAVAAGIVVQETLTDVVRGHPADAIEEERYR